MKKYITCISLTLCSILSAMNNVDQRPVQFAHPLVLFQRLDQHDKKHQSRYAHLAVQSRLHDALGGRSFSRDEAGNFIKLCVKENIPNLSESEVIEHKRTIMNILRPEQPAKL